MNKYLLTPFLFTLLVCTATHAQITFDFTAGSFDGTTWIQTVAGVTCTVTFDKDGTGLDAGTLLGDDGATFIDSSKGLFMGRYVGPPSPLERTGFGHPGARISFSHDVRLKGYTLGARPADVPSFCYLIGGNVTALASYEGGSSGGQMLHEGERSFVLESLVPANKVLAASAEAVGDSEFYWHFETLTVEQEPYVEPVIAIPPGNETGITSIHTYIKMDIKFSFALKNGRLHYWTNQDQILLSRDFHFIGGESGILDLWIRNDVNNRPALLLETVEGYVLFHNSDDHNFYLLNTMGSTLPANPDQVVMGVTKTTEVLMDDVFVMALKDGEIYFDGAFADIFLANMPAELSSGGVSEIAAGSFTALAVKDGKLYAWEGPDRGSGFSLLSSPIPSTVTNGTVLHLTAFLHTGVVQLTTGEVIPFGFGHATPKLTAEQTSGEFFADLRYENGNFIAIREDGSFLMEDKKVGLGYDRIDKGYDGGAFYVEDETGSNEDFLLRGLETFPTIVQQLGYEQISFGHENVAALLPGGRMVLWGGLNVKSTDKLSAHPIQAETVPAQINEILFPQPDLWGTVPQNFYSPSQAQLQELKDGTLEGIQWGGNGNPQYEVQTTSDINDDTSWESLPVGTDPELRYYRIKEITQDTQ